MAKSLQVHLSHRVELQCLQDLEDLPGNVNETGLCSSRVISIIVVLVVKWTKTIILITIIINIGVIVKPGRPSAALTIES